MFLDKVSSLKSGTEVWICLFYTFRGGLTINLPPTKVRIINRDNKLELYPIGEFKDNDLVNKELSVINNKLGYNVLEFCEDYDIAVDRYNFWIDVRIGYLKDKIKEYKKLKI